MRWGGHRYVENRCFQYVERKNLSLCGILPMSPLHGIQNLVATGKNLIPIVCGIHPICSEQGNYPIQSERGKFPISSECGTFQMTTKLCAVVLPGHMGLQHFCLQNGSKNCESCCWVFFGGEKQFVISFLSLFCPVLGGEGV